MAKPPTWDQSKCVDGQEQLAPLIVDWPSAERARLEARTAQGGIAVRKAGCSIDVLYHCTVPGKYAWVPTTQKHDVVRIRDEDELYANLPLGAAKLEGKLHAAGALDVSTTIAGRWQSDHALVSTSELTGSCDGATHVISGLAVGAFRFSTGAKAAVSAAAEMPMGGAGASSKSDRELLAEDGDEKACANPADGKPPVGCGALLRVELVPLGRPKDAAPSCPSGTTWNGTQCAATTVSCAPGTTWNGSVCAASSAQPASVRWDRIGVGAVDVALGTNGTVIATGYPPRTYGHTIWKYSGAGDLWSVIDGGAVRVAVDSHGEPWTVSDDGRIWRHGSNGWTQVGQGGVDIAIGVDGTVWALAQPESGGDYALWRYTGSGMQWTAVPAMSGVRVSATGPSGRALVAKKNGDLYRQTDNGWEKIGIACIDVGGAADGSIWATASAQLANGATIWRWSQGMNWWIAPSEGANIIAAGNEAIYVVTKTGDVWRGRR